MCLLIIVVAVDFELPQSVLTYMTQISIVPLLWSVLANFRKFLSVFAIKHPLARKRKTNHGDIEPCDMGIHTVTVLK